MRVKLHEVADRITGDVDRFNTDLLYYLGGEHYESNEIAIYNKGLLKSESGSKLGFKFHFPFKKGDTIFMSRNPHLRKAGMVTYDGICSDTSYILRTKDPAVLEPRFLPLVIQNDLFWDFFEANKSGSVNYLLNWKEMKNYEFELPCIERQIELADLFWAINDTKEAYKALISKTDDLLKKKFDEMFTEGDMPTKAVSELFTLQMGKTPERKELSYWNSSDYKWISIADMGKYEKYTEDTKEYISALAVEETGIKVVPKDTVIMSFKLTIGRTAITSDDIYTNEAIMAFIPKEDIFDLTYLMYALRYTDWTRDLQAAVKGVTLNKEIIGKTKISLPTKTQQEKFVGFANVCDKSKQELRLAIAKLDSLEKSLFIENFN